MVEFHGYEIQRDAECLEHWQNQKYDEIPMWNRDKLWKRNLLATVMKFQCGIETNCGNAIYWRR